MNRTARRWAAASLLIVAALYAHVTKQWALAAISAALVLAPAIAGARFTLSPAIARIATVAAVAAGGALGWFIPPALGAALRVPWPSLALAGLFAGAVTLASRPRSNDASDPPSALTLIPGLTALTACGEAPLGALYAAASAIYLALALASLSTGRSMRIARRRLAVGALVVVLGAAFAEASAAGLPRLSRWTAGRLLGSMGAETGFSERLWLGSLDGMLESDEIIMRLEGPPTDYLRGAVYDRYDFGHWLALSPATPITPARVAHGARAADRVRVSVVSGARDRYFLPLGAREVETSEPAAAADRFGILRVTQGTASDVTFTPARDDARPDFTVADPTDGDLSVPPLIRADLARIADEWTAGALSPEDKIAAIASHLGREFTYSRSFNHGRRKDPLLDFLLDDHRGHCEYFASATALLARSAGVPARVAVGYRVDEENALGGYWIVREHNAHAWAEVYLPGKGFVTVDTTPADPNAHRRPSFVSALWDLLAARASHLLARITLVHAAGTLLVITAGLVAIQLRRRRVPRAPRARPTAVDRPPPELRKLLDALARRGAARPAWEPLERFAERLAEPRFEGAADLLRRWAAYRYGGVGDERALLDALEGCAEDLRRG